MIKKGLNTDKDSETQSLYLLELRTDLSQRVECRVSNRRTVGDDQRRERFTVENDFTQRRITNLKKKWVV